MSWGTRARRPGCSSHLTAWTAAVLDEVPGGLATGQVYVEFVGFDGAYSPATLALLNSIVSNFHRYLRERNCGYFSQVLARPFSIGGIVTKAGGAPRKLGGQVLIWDVAECKSDRAAAVPLAEFDIGADGRFLSDTLPCTQCSVPFSGTMDTLMSGSAISTTRSTRQ